MSLAPFRVALITLSDRASAGTRSDESGKILREALHALPHTIIAQMILPDEIQPLVAQLIQLADHAGAELILTTGGTGLSSRDITPEATLAVITRRVHGMENAIQTHAFAQTPYAMLSRAVVGVRGHTMIINLPGNPKAVRENLEVVLPVLPHALKLLREETIIDQEHDAGRKPQI